MLNTMYFIPIFSFCPIKKLSESTVNFKKLT